MNRRPILLLLATLAAYPLYADHRVVQVSTNTELRDALSDAQEGDVIELADGSYTPLGPSGQPFFFIVDPGVRFTIQAENPGGALIDGGGTRRLLELRVNTPGQEGWVTFRDLVFTNGDTDEMGNSGGLNLIGARATFVGCDFTNNTATPGLPTGSSSGAITITSDSRAQFNDCLFQGNRSDNHAGAMLVGQGSHVVIHDCQFNDNRSNFYANHRLNALGGAIHVFNGAEGTTTRLDITNTRFFGNEAGFTGGAIMIKGNFANGAQAVPSPSVVTVANSTFEGNTADPHPTVVTNSPTEGGAISVENNASLAVSFSRFVDNTAGFGGAVSTYRGIVVIDQTEIRDNSAFGRASTSSQSRAGAIHAQSNDLCGDTSNLPSSVVMITDSLLEGNSAQLGGCLFVSGDQTREYGACPLGPTTQNRASLTIDNTVLDSCLATETIGTNALGGAVYISLTNAVISDSLLSGGMALATTGQGLGGSIATRKNSRLTATGTTFADNEADDQGGALHFFGGEVASFSGNTLVRNVVAGGGGAATTSQGAAIYATADGTTPVALSGTIANSTFSDHDGLPIRDQGDGCAPSNTLRYNGNTFFNSTFGDDVFFNNVTNCGGACDVAGLNGLVVNGGCGGVDKSTVANVDTGSSVTTGALIAAPADIVSPAASGDVDGSTDAVLGWAWNGGCAELDGQNLASTSGTTEATATGVHTLSVFSGTCVGGADLSQIDTVALGPTPTAELVADPIVIAEGESSLLSWDVTAGAFVSGLITHDVNNDLPGASGGNLDFPDATNTYHLFAVTEQGGATDSATVFVDDPAGDLIFEDGFESGDTGAWAP